ncbi:MAG: DUF5916 domain-containing protein, partial [Fimbriimonadales bacterium]
SPSDATRAWLAYDDQALYVAFYCYDAQPNGIIAREIRPNSSFEGEDRVTFAIDPYNIRRDDSFSSFTVNALGTQSETIAGGRANKREWRGVWEAKAVRTEDGWSVEMRVPWAILPYPDSQSPLRMAINFIRYQARTKIESRWSAFTLNFQPETIGTWQGVQVPPKPRENRPQILVYTAPEYASGSTNQTVRGGLDLRWSLNSQMTALVSLKPDFRNIEGAVERVEFSRREQSLDETRPFFLEGDDYYDTTMRYGLGRVFYSQRIRDFEGGIKLFGNLRSDQQIGALWVHGNDQQAGLFSYQWVPDANRLVRLFGTADLRPNARETLYGTRLRYRQGNWDASFQGAVLQPDGKETVSAYDIAFTYSVPRFFSSWRWMAIESGFRPRLGLIPFDNRRGWSFYNQYGNEYRQGALRRMEASVFVVHTERFNRQPLERLWEVSLNLVGRNDYALGLGADLGEFEGETDRVWKVNLSGNVSDRYRSWRIGYEWGVRSDRSVRYLTAGFTRRLFGRVDLGVNTAVLELGERTRQTVVTLGWEIDSRRALTGRLVQRNGQTNWYLAYRDAGGLGQDLYVIVGDPNARRFTERVAVKMVWAL